MTLPYAQPEPFTSKRNPRTRALLMVGSVFVSMFSSLFFLGALVLLGFIVGGMIGPVYTGFFGLLVLVAFYRSRRLLHRRRVAAVFGIVSHAIRLRLPLPQFISAAAESERGMLRKRLRTVAKNLYDGFPIERAIGESLPELDPRQASLLLASASTGSTPETLDRLSQELTTSDTSPLKSASSLLVYALWTAGLLSLVALFVFTFVLPKFDTIIRDFGGKFDFQFYSVLFPIYVAVAITSAILLFGFINHGMTQLRKRRSTAGRSFLPLSPSRRNRALADFYHASADTLQAGRPFEQLLPSLHGTTQAARLTSDVATLLQSLNSGQSLTDAARGAKLPRGDVAVLALARGPIQLATAFRYLAEVRDRAVSASRDRFLALLSLVLTLLLTLMVIPLIMVIWVPMFRILDLVFTQLTHTRY